MKRFLLMMLLSLGAMSLYAQEGSYLTFWTDKTGFGDIRIYYNDNYAGTITRAYSSAPSCGATGCVTVLVVGQNNTWSAEAEDGSTWSSSKATLTSKCTTQKLIGTPNSNNASTSSGSSGSSGGYGGSYSGSDTDALAAAGVVVLGAMVATGVFFASNDVYVSGFASKRYAGYNFGLRNSMDQHIDIEVGAGNYYNKDIKFLPEGMRTDYDFDRSGMNYEERAKSTWSLDFNFLYNIRSRFGEYSEPLWNPYLGVATSVIVNQPNEFYKGRFGIGPMVGVSFGKRFKGHIRYKALWNIHYETQLFNQIELGFSIKYKYRFTFN